MSSNTIIVTPTDIRTEEEALADAAARGLFAAVRDVVGQVEDWHWHDFAATVYILEGEASAQYGDGLVLQAGAGTIVHQPAGVVHKDVPGVTYRAVFAFDTDPQTWSQPLNKPVTSQFNSQFSSSIS